MHHPNRLSLQRRTWALTQRELASLLGVTADAYSHYELTKTVPVLYTAIALELVFDMRLTSLFPETVSAVASRMLPALADLSIAVGDESSPAAEKKRTLISLIGDRISSVAPGA